METTLEKRAEKTEKKTVAQEAQVREQPKKINVLLDNKIIYDSRAMLLLLDREAHVRG